MTDDIYIKEGDLILIQIKKQISEVLVKDLSPSGNYMRVTTPTGHNSQWINCIYHIETLVSGDEEEEYEDLSAEEEVEENMLGGEFCNVVKPEPEEAEVITQKTLAEFDKRTQRT